MAEYGYVDTYCPECDAEVRAPLHSRPNVISVRGEDVRYEETIAVCPCCGTIIGDSRIEGENLKRAYAKYRSLHGILSPDEIKALRESYGLSLREFSKFLGFGEQTAYRYERGDVPDLSHNTTLLSAKTVEGARLLLSQNGSRLSEKSRNLVQRHIQDMEDGVARKTRTLPSLEDREVIPPSAENGYRRLNLARVAMLVYELANRCHELYWTKLQKAAFFADMVCFERYGCSLTGLSYAHATYGPVIDRKDEIRYILVERGTVTLQEHGWGELLVPQQSEGMPFSAEELSLIDEVAAFVNSFSTASELSEFSHQLACWNATSDGEIIAYTTDDREVGKAMAERMRTHPMA